MILRLHPLLSAGTEAEEKGTAVPFLVVSMNSA